ncbi:MAG: twin-arginine translocase TatA/TatE family subunit [Planctomycetota bacterium]|jgi:sec-independent protein translocase protein TatA
MLGSWEIIAICLLILLIFGGKKIPEVARGLGKGLQEFKKARKDITESIDFSDDNDDNVKSNAVDSASTEKLNEQKAEEHT